MPQRDPKKAKKHLARLRQLVAEKKGPFSRMSEEEIVKAIRKTREDLWTKKLAPRP